MWAHGSVIARYSLAGLNFETQLKTDGCCECFSSKCPLILEDLRTDVKFLESTGQEEEQQTRYGLMEL